MCLENPRIRELVRRQYNDVTAFTQPMFKYSNQVQQLALKGPTAPREALQRSCIGSGSVMRSGSSPRCPSISEK